MLPPTVLLMLKTPRPGAVKTRLGSQIGVDAACAAYRALVEHQLRHVPQEWPIQVCYEPADAHEEMCAWLGARHAYSPQAAGDLGHRLADATRRHFEKCRAPVVIIGGDCPYLDQARFAEVELLMASVDVALVPALDGGYCLIALRRPEPRLFETIPWSTSHVLAETRARLIQCELRWHELDSLEDVDDLASWKRAVAAFPELETKLENGDRSFQTNAPAQLDPAPAVQPKQ